MELVGYLPYVVGILLLIGLAFWLGRTSRTATERKRDSRGQLLNLILDLGGDKAHSLVTQSVAEVYAQIKQKIKSAKEEQAQAEKDLALTLNTRNEAAEALRLQEKLVRALERLLAACKKRTTETERMRALFMQLVYELGLNPKPETKEEEVDPTPTTAPA